MTRILLLLVIATSGCFALTGPGGPAEADSSADAMSTDPVVVDQDSSTSIDLAQSQDDGPTDAGDPCEPYLWLEGDWSCCGEGGGTCGPTPCYLETEEAKCLVYCYLTFNGVSAEKADGWIFNPPDQFISIDPWGWRLTCTRL